MAKSLVIVESPAKARTINKFLGRNYIVKASNGHVRDLPKNKLGVDVEKDFQPTYVRLRDASKTVKALTDAAKQVDQVLVATDPDREGEAIGWHVAELLKKTEKPISRVVFNEITKRAVVQATQHPRSIDANLVDAQQARRVLDRLVGYKISPMLQWSVRKGLSAGRVQSVAARLVCDRENEIRSFVAVEYWTLDAELLTIRDESFTARLNRIRGEKAELPDEAHTQEVMKAVEGARFEVSSVERKEVRRRPYPPFITSTLQQDASRKLRFGPRKTMRIAQQLYEGIQLGDEGRAGLITYMRTDSTRLAGEAIDEVRRYIAENFEAGMLPEKPNFFRSKKDAQDAHEAIRPTAAARTPEMVQPYLDKDQLALYTLIWKRFVACQMAPAVMDQTTVDVAAGDYEFRSVGTIVRFPGFTKFYEESSDNDVEEKNGQKALPEISQGESASLNKLTSDQHFTKPPPRYSEASLIRALEEKGIGRPSTYAPTLNTIQERGYVAREKGRLVPTELGEQVNELLVKHFPDILDVAFTARMEDELDHVEEGNREWHEVIRAFYGDFSRDLELAQRKMVKDAIGEDVRCPKCGGEMELREGWYGAYMRCKQEDECDGRISLRKKAQTEPTDEICEKCGAPMVIRSGRFGRFMACTNYPKCKQTHNVDEHGNKVEKPPKEEPVRTDQTCPDCGGTLLIRKNRRGEPFYGCEKYPKCRFTKPMELGLKCPQPGCEGDLVEKRMGRRRFIGCDQYPKCDFAAYGQLDKETPCPKCGHAWTTVVRSRSKPTVRRCPAPACGHEETLPEDDDQD